MNIRDLEKRVKDLENRNKRVEIDKAWETSMARRALLVIFTYLSVGIYMWVIGVNNPWLNAVIPSTAFLLSTLTLPFFKKMWIEKR